MNDATNTDRFIPQEVAYRKWTNGKPGKWKRRVLLTEKAFDKFIEKLLSEDYDIETRDH